MKTEKASLILYIVSSLLAITATILNNDLLMILTRPAIIPAVLFYYLSIKKQKTNIFFVSVLALNFIGDTIAILKSENITLLLMIPYFIAYLILLKFAIEDLKKMKFKKSGLILSILVFSFLMYMMYALIQLFIDTNPELVIPIIIYGIVLGTYGSIATYCHYLKNSTKTFFMIMVALTSIVSDVFYVMFSLIFHFLSFNYFEFTVQLISYFFMVRYFVLRKE